MLSFVVLAAAIILITFFIQRLALGPLNALPQLPGFAAQFQLIDFISLIIYIQVVLGFSLRAVPGDLGTTHFVVGGTGLAVALLLWGGSVLVLSRAGIRDNRRRAVCVLIAVPGAVFLILAAIGKSVLGDSPALFERLGFFLAASTGACLLRPIASWIAGGSDLHAQVSKAP